VSAVKEDTNVRETFAELYEEYMPKVYRYIHYKVSNTHVAEDLTSTVFEKALTNFSRFSSSKASFSTWVFSIARNTIIDHYRVQGRRRTVSLEEATETTQVVTGDLSPEEELLKSEERQRLQVCLSELSREEQDIISLKFGSELNNRQIAKMLGISESSVGTKLYRMVRKLRDSFQEPENA